MVHPESSKYQQVRSYQLPHFTDFADPRFAYAHGGFNSGCIQKIGWLQYWQWLHCVGNWGEEHSMCKKTRWYCERMIHEHMLEKLDEKKALGHFDYTILYGARPWKGFEAHYQPVKKNRKGAYEFWLDRDFEPVLDTDAGNWKEKAPILFDILVQGKKPIYDDE